jgi:hypothetical protein
VEGSQSKRPVSSVGSAYDHLGGEQSTAASAGQSRRSLAFSQTGAHNDGDVLARENAELQTRRNDDLCKTAADTYDSPRAASLPGVAAASDCGHSSECGLDCGFVTPQVTNDDYDMPRARSTAQQPEYEEAIHPKPTSNSFA